MNCVVDLDTVTKNIPGYLKLHTEDQVDSSGPKAADIRGLEGVCRALTDATGWKLDYRPAEAAESSTTCRWSMPIESSPDNGARRLVLQPSRSPDDALPLGRVEPLAEAIGQLLIELQETRHALWQREAELAAGIPVTLRPDDSQHLAERLEGVLRGGAEAIGCQAAALYLLDDTTSHLKLRTCWGLPQSRLLDSPRPLRGAVSDLEALVGHAVALEDTTLLPHWKPPEQFPAALCVPVSSANTPLGTLWFFCDRVRDFTDEQTHLAEIIAGRLVADLEREVLVSHRMHPEHDDQAIRIVAKCQAQLAPCIPPLIEGWQVAGKTFRPETAGGDFYDWCILPDSQLAVAVGHAEGNSTEAALTATILQSALKAHAAYRHEPRQMLERLNEALWAGSTGDRFASVWYAVIDPERGTLQYAGAGHSGAVIRSPSDSQQQVLSVNRPLLGSDPDTRFINNQQSLDAGQSLVLFSPGIRDSFDSQGHALDEKRLPTILAASGQATAEEQVDAVFEAIASSSSLDRTVVVARHLY